MYLKQDALKRTLHNCYLQLKFLTAFVLHHLRLQHWETFPNVELYLALYNNHRLCRWSGKSSLIIHERYANLKYKHGNRSFWYREYYVDTVGKNAKRITKYIQNQLEEDKSEDQLTFREHQDTFKGSK